MMDFFVQGLMHPLLMPEHLMVLIALGLLAGQQGLVSVKTTVPLSVIAIFCSVGLTLLLTLRFDFEVWLLLLALFMGLLIVVRPGLPVWLLIIVAMAVALLVGLDSAAPRIPGLRGMKVQALLGGTALSAGLVVIASSLLGLAVRNVLEGIPLRVLGAWITAGAMLVLALSVTNTVL